MLLLFAVTTVAAGFCGGSGFLPWRSCISPELLPADKCHPTTAVFLCVIFFVISVATVAGRGGERGGA